MWNFPYFSWPIFWWEEGKIYPCSKENRASQVALVVKKLPANARVLGFILGLERSPGEGNSNPPSILAREIQWREEPGGLQSLGSQRVGHNLANKQQRRTTGTKNLLDLHTWNINTSMKAIRIPDKTTDFKPRQIYFWILLLLILAPWPWPNYLTYRSLYFLICQIKILQVYFLTCQR